MGKGKTSEDRGLITLDNHLCNTSASQSFASNELLALHTRKCIESGGNNQENSGGDQTASSRGKADPLDSTEEGVYGSSHPVGRKAADEAIEFGGGRADSEEERYFDE